MLATRAVLGKDLRPDVRITGYFGDRAPPTLNLVDLPLRQHDLDRLPNSDDRIVLLGIEIDAQHVAASYTSDVAVAQIHSEKVGVRGKLVLVEGFEPPLCPF